MNEELKNKMVEIINKHVGDAFFCGRAWSAWSVGTMSDRDFTEVSETDAAHDLSDALMNLIQEELAKQKPIGWLFTQQGFTHFTEDKRDWYDAVGVEEVIPLYSPPLYATVPLWKPIETAPMDTFVLLAGPSGYTTIETVVTTGRRCSDYHAGRWIDHANDELTEWGFEPTHWMPLIPLYAAPQPAAVPDGWQLVKTESLRYAYQQAKVSGDCIVGFAKSKPGEMCGWLDDACTCADSAAKALNEMLQAAPAAPATPGSIEHLQEVADSIQLDEDALQSLREALDKVQRDLDVLANERKVTPEMLNKHYGALSQHSLKRHKCFPEMDTTKPAEQQGLFHKFDVRRVDGSSDPGGKHHGCRYFVLDLDHDKHAPAAMRAYAEDCRETHPQLAAELVREFGTVVHSINYSLAQSVHELRRKLADSQAREKSLRGQILRMIDRWWPFVHNAPMASETARGLLKEASDSVQPPYDTSALDSYVQEACSNQSNFDNQQFMREAERLVEQGGEVMRERCMADRDSMTLAEWCHLKNRLRALPSVTLEDVRKGGSHEK